MSAAEFGDTTSRPDVCPNCGYAVERDWSFCGRCGYRLGGNRSFPAPPETPARHVSAILAFDLPNVIGVPGRIIGVKVSHGWAAACGYFDIHEVADGRAVKTRKITPARGGGRFLSRWFDAQSVEFDDVHQMRLAAILQNIRYCDAGKRQDGTTVIEPRNKGLFMRVTFEDALGSLKSLDIHADAEYGQDEGSRRARDVIRVIEYAFGSSRAIDSLLVIHRKGPMLRVVMNGPLYVHIGPGYGDSYSVVDCDSEDVLKIEVNECFDERFLEARVYGLRDGWVSSKAMFPIEDGAVVRLKPEDFTWEGWWDEAILSDPRPREGAMEREEWVIACASWPYGFEKRIDATPFLEGYEPFVTPGTYAVKTWLEQDDEDQDAWFARPLPEKVDLADPPYLPSVHGVGTFRERRDLTMHKVARQIQLEEGRYYFLTEYLGEDGAPLGEYSFDMEGAHDSHYQFSENEVPRLRRLMGVGNEAPLADAMIAFIRKRSGGELNELVWKIKTSSISY